MKIAWSKKDSAEYQHKASKEAIECLTSELWTLSSSEFTMDDVLPLSNGGGENLPSYQVYLVLAWLRSWGGIRKKGRGEYQVAPETLTEEGVAKQWSALTLLTEEGEAP